VLADGTTTNLDLIKPEDGASIGTWGPKVNSDFDVLDAAIISHNYAENAAGHSGLDFAYKAGVVRQGTTVSATAAGSVTLADNDTSYVEVNPADGVVSDNITGFTVGRIPLFEVTTAAGAITVVTDKRTLVSFDDNIPDTLTTKGDLLVYNGTAYARLPVGSDTQVLVADSGEASGIKWGGSSGGSLSISERIAIIGTYRDKIIAVMNPWNPKTATYKGQLHTHTTASDGTDTPTALVTAYKNAGYDFVAITDHDVATADPSVAGILFVPGVEETASEGHILALNVTAQSALTGGQEIINAINAAGGMAQLNHANFTTYLLTDTEISGMAAFGLFEVYNQGVETEDSTGNAEDKYDTTLTANKRAWLTATDDCHDVSGATFNKAWVVVHAASLTLANVMTELANGNFYATQGPVISDIVLSENVITVTTPVASTIKWIKNNGEVIKTTAGVTSDTHTIVGDEVYVRIEITRDSDSLQAWSQPIYVMQLSDTATRVTSASVGSNPCCRVYHDAAQSIANATWTTLAFNSEYFDTDTMHDAVTNNSRITVKTAGKYRFRACVDFNTDGDGVRAVRLRYNGTTYIAKVGVPTVSAAGGPTTIVVDSGVIDCAVNDYVEVRVYHSAGGAIDVNAVNYSPIFDAVLAG